MELSDLRVFMAVVEEGGVTRAAEKLHRVQSNVTTRVRQLEDKLGVKLFDRQGKKLLLTGRGQVLAGYAEELLALAERARTAVQGDQPQGLLRIGTMESTAAMRLPAVLSEYSRRYPDVRIELTSGNPQRISQAILAGEVDVGFAAEPIAENQFEIRPAFEERLGIVSTQRIGSVVGNDSREANTALALEPGCPHRTRLEEWFAVRGEMPERIVELSSHHAVLGCVVAGMGIALLPLNLLEGYPQRHLLRVHELPPGLDRATTMLFWRANTSSPNVAALAQIVEEQRSGHAQAVAASSAL